MMMNSEIKIQSGERLSFSKLFTEKNLHIEIPIIQRDYAQGRKSSSEVRVNFLDALSNYLEENKPNRDLDFIYGSIINKGYNIFIPLDGQQRLTTLFLLHWYLANISDNTVSFRDVLSIKKGESLKSKFTYETRTSSREFCDELISRDFDLKNLLPADKDKQNSLSKTIQDCGWYYLSWENDPTIQSMLTMLDDIHIKFYSKPQYYARLIDSKKPIITFFFLNLNEFKLTDDLYIKMNARGKSLTTFENFKAKFEQHIDNLEWENENKVSQKEYFAHKIDTSWADLLWQYRDVNIQKDKKDKKGKKDNAYDDELMHFIRVIFANECAVTTVSDKNPSLEYLIGTEVAKKRDDYTDNLTFYLFKSFDILTKEAVNYLIDALDVLSNGNNKIRLHIGGSYYYNEEEVFKSVLNHSLSFVQRVQFHAYLKYLIAHKTDRSGIYQWMRFIHNLTENRNFDSANDVARAIKEVNKLIPISNDVLGHLKKEETDIGFFVGRQIQEEIIKAHLITKSNEWRTAIERVEKHSFFKGQIGFLLEFSQILSFYTEHKNCNWSEQENTSYLEKFNTYSEKAIAVFSYIHKSSKELNYLWERAVLSKGDYFIRSTAWRKNMLSTTKNIRDYSWKRLLRIEPDGDKNSEEWINKRKFVKEVFDDDRFESHNLRNSLENICTTLPNDWRKYFIKNAKLIEYCKQGFIRFGSKTDIKLYKEKQQNHTHQELFTTVLYHEMVEDKTRYLPFSLFKYLSVKNGGYDSSIRLSGFTNVNTDYSFSIYYTENKRGFLPHPFQVCFKKTSSENTDTYNYEISNILKSFSLEKNDEIEGFWISKETQDGVVELLEELCKVFKERLS